MITDLQPYPAYKDCGVPWLGQVPEHWQVRSLGSLTTAINQRGRPDLPLLSVVREKGVIPRSTMSDEENRNFVPDDLSNYKVVRRGNLVINKMKAWQGSLGIAPSDGVVSPAYFVFDISMGDRRFGQTLLRSKPYVGFFARASDGVRIGQWDLSKDAMKRIPVLVPPLDEQSAIVRFLDHADRRIRRYIRAKQRLIALLNEQKQAIIHRAVTRGLDPNVPLKPSGVEWLGDVPEHWQVRRLRNVIVGRLTYGANAAAEFSNREWPRYLRITDFGGNGRLRPDTFRSLPLEIAEDYLVEPGDLLFARSGATVGKTFLVDSGIGPACHAGYLIRARPNRAIVRPEYLFAFTQSRAFARWKDSTFIIATIQNIGADKYADLPVALPPLDEQSRILESVRRELQPNDAAVSCADREIDLIREYRTRLITDVVTGKVDVRHPAPPPGEELPEALQLLEEEALEDGAEALESEPNEGVQDEQP